LGAIDYTVTEARAPLLCGNANRPGASPWTARKTNDSRSLFIFRQGSDARARDTVSSRPNLHRAAEWPPAQCLSVAQGDQEIW